MPSPNFFILVSAYGIEEYNTQKHVSGACKRQKAEQCGGFWWGQCVGPRMPWGLQTSSDLEFLFHSATASVSGSRAEPGRDFGLDP